MPKQMAKAALFIALGSGCESTSAEPIQPMPRASIEASPLPPRPPPIATPNTAQTIPSSAPSSTPITTLPFAEWMVSNCQIDELAPSAYTIAWFRYRRPADLLGPDDPPPQAQLKKLPEPGSDQAISKAREITLDWLNRPRSHVIDCSFLIEPRDCPRCKRGPVLRAHYIAYLPQALFQTPNQVQGMLFLIPGGNGGRTRPFMRPIPGHVVFERGSGGLDTKRLADAFYREHPQLPGSLIISLETAAGSYENGPTEHLTRDLPHHLQSIFLPHLEQNHKKAFLGAEGLSSGAAELYRAAFFEPHAFHTLGFSCMSCTGIDPRQGRLGGRPALLHFADSLAERRKLGEFEVHFAIGEYDGQLPCNRALYKELLAKGAAPNTENNPEAFRIYPEQRHDFDFLRISYPNSLYWQLNTLGSIAAAKTSNESPKEQTKAPP